MLRPLRALLLTVTLLAPLAGCYSEAGGDDGGGDDASGIPTTCAPTRDTPNSVQAELCPVADEGISGDPGCFPGGFCWWSPHPPLAWGFDMVTTSAGETLVADGTGIVRLERPGFAPALRPASLEGWTAQRLWADARGGVWASAWLDTGAVVVFERRAGHWLQHTFPDSVQPDARSLSGVGATPWIALRTGGALRFRTGAWERVEFDGAGTDPCVAMAGYAGGVACATAHGVFLHDGAHRVARLALPGSGQAPLDVAARAPNDVWLLLRGTSGTAPQGTLEVWHSDGGAFQLAHSRPAGVAFANVRPLAIRPRLHLFSAGRALVFGPTDESAAVLEGGRWTDFDASTARGAHCAAAAEAADGHVLCAGRGLATLSASGEQPLVDANDSQTPEVLSNLAVENETEVRFVSQSGAVVVSHWDGRIMQASSPAPTTVPGSSDPVVDNQVVSGITCVAGVCWTANSNIRRLDAAGAWSLELTAPGDAQQPNAFHAIGVTDPFGSAGGAPDALFALDVQFNRVWYRADGRWTEASLPAGAHGYSVDFEEWAVRDGVAWNSQGERSTLVVPGADPSQLRTMEVAGLTVGVHRPTPERLYVLTRAPSRLALYEGGAQRWSEPDSVHTSANAPRDGFAWLGGTGDTLWMSDGLAWVARGADGVSRRIARTPPAGEIAMAADGTLFAVAYGGGLLRRTPAP